MNEASSWPTGRQWDEELLRPWPRPYRRGAERWQEAGVHRPAVALRRTIPKRWHARHGSVRWRCSASGLVDSWGKLPVVEPFLRALVQPEADVGTDGVSWRSSNASLPSGEAGLLAGMSTGGHVSAFESRTRTTGWRRVAGREWCQALKATVSDRNPYLPVPIELGSLS
jgi:hypothetical protein